MLEALACGELLDRPPSRRLLLLRLECLFAVAPYHDDRQEAADDGAAEDDEDDGNANGPDARQEERVKDVVLVNKGLTVALVVSIGEVGTGRTMKSVQTV